MRATRQAMPADRTRAPRLSREKGCRPLTVFSTNELKIPQGAIRSALIDRDWNRDRDRQDMTSGREKPDVCWVDVCWVDVCRALPSKNMNQTSFWLNS